MQRLLFLISIIVLVYTNTLYSQSLPNGNFNNWEIKKYQQPDSGWFTNNLGALSVFDTVICWQTGTFIFKAVHLQTKIIGTDTLAGYLSNTNKNPFLGIGGFPYSQIPSTIIGHYKYNLPGNDSATLIVIFKSGGSIVSTNVFKIRDSTGTLGAFTYFGYPLSLSVIPDSVIIAISSSNISGIGIENKSWIEFDDISFLGPGISEHIINGSFERWDTLQKEVPTAWNIMTDDMSCKVSKTTDGYNGMFGIQLETTTSFDSLNKLKRSNISTGKLHKITGSNKGRPYSNLVDTLTGYYKFTPSGTDSGYIAIKLYNSGTNIGTVSKSLPAATNWTYFELPFSSLSTPDTIGIDASSSKLPFTTTTPGSILKLDYLQLKSQSLPVPGNISGINQLCVGSTTTLSVTDSGGYWSASNYNATVTFGGIVNSYAAGNDTIYYTVFNEYGASSAKYIMSVFDFPHVPTIVGPSGVCFDTVAILTDSLIGGIWASTNLSIARVDTIDSILGACVLTPISGGTVIIKYNVTNVCGTIGAVKTITISTPDAGNIVGETEICSGSYSLFTDSMSGGTWNVSNNNAIISFDGLLGGLTEGLDTISYTIINSCGTITSSKEISVLPILVVDNTYGEPNVCEGSNVILFNSSSGGIWSAINSHVTVSLGDVYGITPGIDTILYTISNICGSSTSSFIINVNPLPDGGIILGPSEVCEGSSISFDETSISGIWSLLNTNAIISSTGYLFGITTGIDTILYTVDNSCGTAMAQKIITINPLPNAGVIIGASNVCTGSYITLTNLSISGTWISTNGLATVSDTGTVYGVAVGLDTIIYKVTNSCGTDSTIHIISIQSLPNAGIILGGSSVCIGAIATLTDSISTGIWSETNGKLLISATGFITGLNQGIDTVKYKVSNICGSDTAKKVISVIALPNAGTLIGLSDVCIGDSIILTDSTIGGNWSSENTNASVTGGVVTGILKGTDVIKYTVTNLCGTDVSSKIINILSLPNAGLIIGKDTVCVGTNITLSDTVLGGFWTSSNPNVFITELTGGTSKVLGVLNGLDTIMYRVTNYCGTDTKQFNVTVLDVPNVSISGRSYACISDTNILNGLPAGGVWSSINTNAFISNIGELTGITTGYDSIIYSVTNYCGIATSVLPLIVYSEQQCDSINYVKPLASFADKIKIYPNPNNGVFNIQFSSNYKAIITITDITGKTMLKDNLINTNSDIYTYDLSKIDKGVYFVEVFVPLTNEYYREKLIIW